MSVGAYIVEVFDLFAHILRPKDSRLAQRVGKAQARSFKAVVALLKIIYAE